MLVYVLLGVVALLAILLVVLFNNLVGRRQMVRNGWSDIDVQLKRRSDLIPRLIDVTKGYAAHERALFEELAQKRSQAADAGNDPVQRAAAESALSAPVARLVAVAEAYPDLKASQNFLDLQNELTDTENKIEMARRFYNGAARELNTAVETFPGNLVAGALGFSQTSYFEIETADRALPQTSFGS